MTLRFTVIALLVFSIWVLPLPAKRKPFVETRPEHQDALRRGFALHDEGKFAEAIEEYRKILAQNPDDVLAMYEIAYSFSAMREFRKCREMAQDALEYEAPDRIRAQLYVALGSCFDDDGNATDAVKTYRKGLKEYGDSQLLHFNLGVTHHRHGNSKEARASLQNALRLDPMHASSHYMLGLVYLQANYRMPAVLALSRFLTLEPTGPRAADACQRLLRALLAGVDNQGPGNVKVTVFSGELEATDEGDFRSAGVMLPLVVAGFASEDNKSKPPHEKLELAYSIVFENLLREGEKPKGFAQSFYGPYFQELAGKGHIPAFLRFGIRELNGGDAAGWMQANQEKVKDFLSWSEGYAWPRGK